MKTLHELYKEMTTTEELKKEFVTAVKDRDTLGFLKAHGVETTEEEMDAFFKEMADADTSLSADQLEKAAGGIAVEVVLSLIPGIGTVVCGTELIASAASNGKHVNLSDDSQGFCTED